MEEEEETQEILKVLKSLKQASQKLQTNPEEANNSCESDSSSSSTAIKALLELDTESDPNLSNLSNHLSDLKILISSLQKSKHKHGSIKSFLTRRVKSHEITRVAESIESEIQGLIDRESIMNLTSQLREIRSRRRTDLLEPSSSSCGEAKKNIIKLQQDSTSSFHGQAEGTIQTLQEASSSVHPQTDGQAKWIIQTLQQETSSSFHPQIDGQVERTIQTLQQEASSSFHSQTDGQAKRIIQTLQEDMLRACVIDFKGNDHLPSYEEEKNINLQESSSSFHPQIDGQAEQTIQTLEEDMLRTRVIDFKGNWDDHLPSYEEKKNITLQESSSSFHPQTDGQAERTIQTSQEDMLRARAIDFKGNWDDHLPSSYEEKKNITLHLQQVRCKTDLLESSSSRYAEEEEENEIIEKLTLLEHRLSEGFNMNLQDLLLKSNIFYEIEFMLCSPNASQRVREKAGYALKQVVLFNKDVFVGQVLMGQTIKALVSMDSLCSLQVLTSLIRAIRSPLVDVIESVGGIPKVISCLSSEDLAMKLTSMNCVLEIAYFGRKEAIEAMLNCDLIDKLVQLQRSELGGDLIDLGKAHQNEDEDENEEEEGVDLNNTKKTKTKKKKKKKKKGYLERHPFASCVARFGVQLEVGEGLRQREKRGFKQEILKKIREACDTDAQAATIVAEVLWGSSP